MELKLSLSRSLSVCMFLLLILEMKSQSLQHKWFSVEHRRCTNLLASLGRHGQAFKQCCCTLEQAGSQADDNHLNIFVLGC